MTGEARLHSAQTHGLRRISIQPRQVQYKLPGGPFTEQHLTDFTAAAQADSTDQKTQCVAGVSPLLGDAWEMAGEPPPTHTHTHGKCKSSAVATCVCVCVCSG